jgi:hypothetical protein
MRLVSRIFRLSRAQFLPVILSPVLVGSVLAWWTDHSFSPFLFVSVVLGGIFLHLGANPIGDADHVRNIDGLWRAGCFGSDSWLSEWRHHKNQQVEEHVGDYRGDQATGDFVEVAPN